MLQLLRRPLPQDVVVLGCFLGLSLLLFAPADLAATTRLIGATTADNSQQAWFLAWLPHAIASGTDPLISHAIDAPTGVNLMWNTWMPLPSLLLWPVTALAGPLAAFDSLVTLAAALSAFAMFAVTRRWVRRRSAAVAAGLAYGFSPYVLVHAYTGHANLALAVTPPLLLLLLDSIVVRGSLPARRGGLWLGAVVLVQLFTTEELLASELVAAAVVLLWLAVLHPRQARRGAAHLARSLAWAMLVVVPVAAYPLWVQFFGPLALSHAVSDNAFYITDLANVVLPTDVQGVDPGFAQAVALHYLGNSGEWAGYVGLPMLAVATLTAGRLWSRPLVRAATLSSITLLLFSFGSSLHVAGVDTHIPMPGLLLAHLPVLNNLLPARFGVYVDLGTALLLALAVEALPRTRPAARAGLLGGVLLVVAYLPPLPFPTRAAPVPSFFTTSPHPYAPGATLLVLPFARDFDSADAMRWQAAGGFWFAMPEGYAITRLPGGGAGTGPPPSATSTLFSSLQEGRLTPAQVADGDLAAVVSELRREGVDGVVLVDGTPHADAIRTVVDAVVGRLGGTFGGDTGGALHWQIPVAGGP
ncbi:MAG: hypothetical protein ACYDAC_06790 [Candidatus Dormibacteria bacterium]